MGGGGLTQSASPICPPLPLISTAVSKIKATL